MSQKIYRPVRTDRSNHPATPVPRARTDKSVKQGMAHKPDDIRPGGYETPYREPLQQDHGVDNDDWPDKTETGEEL